MQAHRRAALYLRQSLDVQEGIDRQRDRCAALALARGWTIAGEYVDNDTSATKARAAGTAWARLLDDARLGALDVVVATDLDRLVRSTRDLVTLADTGAAVLTVDGEIDLTTADGEFRATMLAGIARFETRRKGERQKRANATRASSGRPFNAQRAFGYEPDGVTIRETEAAELRRAYQRILAGGSLRSVVNDWQARGVMTTGRRYKGEHKGEPSNWSGQTLRSALLNPRYIGKRTYHGEVVADAVWPAIIDEPTFLAVESILRDPSRRRAPHGGRYLLSGLALCGVCDGTVHAGGSSRGVPSYRCGRSSGHISRKAQVIEEYVDQVVVARLSRPDARELLSRGGSEDLQPLMSEAAGVRQRLNALAVDFADGTLTAQQLRIATDRLRTRLEAIEAHVAASTSTAALAPILEADDVAEAWTRLDLELKRPVIDALMTVRVFPAGQGAKKFRPETVGIEWRSE